MNIENLTTTIYSNNLKDLLKDWKSYGAVSTPEWIVQLMIKLADLDKQQQIDVLEPACGLCNFLFGIYINYPNNIFTGLEYNKDIYLNIEENLSKLHFNLLNHDYILWNTKKRYDLIIGNPPYGIIGNKSHYPIHILNHKKNEYKKRIKTWHGKYNIYGAFIEKSVFLLKKSGKLVFIVPATWMILDDFKKLRKFLSLLGKTNVYYLGKNVFKKVNVTSCIIVFEKKERGAELFEISNDKVVPKLKIPNWNGSMLRFENRETKSLEKDKSKVGDLFNIKISARSPEVKKCEMVYQNRKNNSSPFMKGKNIKKGSIDRMNYSGFWMNSKNANKFKPFYGVVPRIVVGHTKGGKIVAALENKIYPYLGDVYHLLPKYDLNKADLNNIVEWLNSSTIENYMTTMYKDISPHTTASQLKEVPLNISKQNQNLLI